MKNAELFDEYVALIQKSWNQNTIYPGLLFDTSCRARGQCEPTVCVIQDIFGGDIYKIENDPSIAPKKTHYYNYIDGKFYDLTKDQFYNAIPYENGTLLTQKQSDMLRRTSYCNRMVRYICLKNEFDRQKIFNAKEGINAELQKVGNFFIDAGSVLFDAPWEEIIRWFPELFKLIIFIMDCNYNSKSDLMGADVMKIIEHYLDGYYSDDIDNLIKQWRDKIIVMNGKKFVN